MEKRGREYIVKKAFADAYLELAEEKPLRKISVSDIAGRCGLSRVTFYNHFSEKHDLLLWTYVSVFGAFSIFRSRLENNEKHIIADSSVLDLKNIPEGLRRYFQGKR